MQDAPVLDEAAEENNDNQFTEKAIEAAVDALGIAMWWEGERGAATALLYDGPQAVGRGRKRALEKYVGQELPPDKLRRWSAGDNEDKMREKICTEADLFSDIARPVYQGLVNVEDLD